MYIHPAITGCSGCTDINIELQYSEQAQQEQCSTITAVFNTSVEAVAMLGVRVIVSATAWEATSSMDQRAESLINLSDIDEKLFSIEATETQEVEGEGLLSCWGTGCRDLRSAYPTFATCISKGASSADPDWPICKLSSSGAD